MRVLQLGKYYFPYMGGIETHIQVLSHGLRSTCEVEVLVCNERRRFSRESVSGVDVTRVPSIRRIFSTEICPTLVTELSRRAYDILHLHTPNPMGMLAYVLAKKPSNHRLIVTHHSDTIRQARLRRAFEPVFRAVMNRADAVIATSRRYRESSGELREYLHKTEVIPYGLSTARFAEAQTDEVATLRSKYGPRMVLAVGRLIYYKGFDVLLDAMTCIDAQAVVVGSGPLEASLKAKARRLSLESRVHFVGDVHNDRIRPYYGAADVFVLPSVARSEAFGIVQIEAMAAGLPVVNTELDSGVPEISLDGRTGLTVPPGDPSAMAGAINRLLEDAELRRRLGDAGRRRAWHEFDSAPMLNKVVDLYRRVSSAKPVS